MAALFCLFCFLFFSAVPFYTDNLELEAYRQSQLGIRLDSDCAASVAFRAVAYAVVEVDVGIAFCDLLRTEHASYHRLYLNVLAPDGALNPAAESEAISATTTAATLAIATIRNHHCSSGQDTLHRQPLASLNGGLIL